MSAHYGIGCWITDVPWLDHTEVRLAAPAGRKAHHAIGVADGNILWEEHDASDEVQPFLKLGPGELEAFARALGERTQTNDETRAALKDTRQTRDRLLALVEAVLTGKANP